MENIYNKIWESAMNSIKARMTSKSELKKKLMRKFPEEEGNILRVLDEMERVELLNDKRYTEQLIHHLTLRPIGRLKLMIETRNRGLDKDLVDELLMNIGYDEEENAKKAYDEKVKTVREADPRKRKFKLMNFLKGRGFTDSVIWHVVK
jgi:SOS response regulatory protein OraA/RecX